MMAMKKKLAVSTVAASMVFSTLAGLPVSTKGLFEKLGLQAGTAQAAAAPGTDTIIKELNQVSSNLWSQDEKDAVSQARSALYGLTDAALVSEITAILDKKIAGSEDYDQLTDDNILKLFTTLGLFFNAEEIKSGSKMSDLLVQKNLKPVIDQLAKLSGAKVTLEVQDAVDFAVAAEAALKDRLASEDLVVLSTNKDAIKQVIKDAAQKVLDNKGLDFSVVFKNLEITSEAVSAVAHKTIAAADPSREASEYIALALMRSDANETFARTNDYPTNSQYQKYQFTVLGKALPGASINWTSSNSSISVQKEAGSIILYFNGTGTVSTTIEGKLVAPGTNLDGKVLVKEDVSMSYTRRSNGGGGGGGAVVSPTTPGTEQATGTQSALNDLKKQLEGATAEQKQQLLEQAQAKVAEAIAKISTIDVASLVTVSGDKGTVKLDTAKLVQQIKDIAAESKKLLDALKELDPAATAPKVELTLNFGAVTAKSLDVPLSKELLSAAKDNGIDKVAIALSGVAIAVDPRTFGADTSLTITKQEATAATSVTQLPVASGVYEFEFTSNGAKVTNFTNPVELRLSVNDPSKFDAEKLVLAKIVDGKLQFFGGKYSAKDKQVLAKRNSFSMYTVVENNVVFGDTASVKSWAGRQIEVAAAKGILEGRGDKEFVPNGTVTRAEFAKMIVKTFGLEDASATESFNDVSDDDWFKPYVAAAVKSGLVNGREAGKFDPNGKITRAEMATIAARALQSVNGVKASADADSLLKNFEDAKSIHDSLKAGVALSVGQGIIVGEEGNKFNPNADSTRAQAAVVIYRLLNK